jgi:hypothetical protein
LPLQTHTFVSTQHVEAGTASYMAPECFKGSQGLSEKVRARCTTTTWSV